MLKEYEEMKEEIKNLKTTKFMEDLSLFIKQCYHFFEVPNKYRE